MKIHAAEPLWGEYLPGGELKAECTAARAATENDAIDVPTTERTCTMKRIRRLGAALAAGSLAIVLAACSSQGGAASQPGAAAGGGGGAVTGGKNFTFAMITHEQAGDTFWDKIRAGAKDAAATHGIDLKYSNNENGPDNAPLVQNAIDSKVDGIALTLSNAAQVIPVSQKAVAAGIPVVVFNQGFADY